jgi:PKD domain/Secretion system C-terminal sorting domain
MRSIYLNTKIVAVLATIFSQNACIIAQKNDYNWLFGSEIDHPTNLIKGDDTLYSGSTNFDFNSEPVKIYRDGLRFTDFLDTNAAFSDNEGKLRSYTNGMHIYQNDDIIIENGDSVLYGAYWENWNVKNVFADTIAWMAGLSIPQSILYLPSPRDVNNVYMLNQFINYDIRTGTRSNSLHYCLIDMQANAGKGKVIEKDVMIIDTILSYGYVQATRHANGRDWWILALSYGHKTIYSILLDPTGFHIINEFPTIGDQIGKAWGQGTFNTEGTQFVMLASRAWDLPYLVWLFDFDRSTGKYSNQRVVNVKRTTNLNVYFQGIAFSPSGRFFYTGNGETLFQFDVSQPDLQASMRLVAYYDGFISYFGSTTQFYRWLIAPDGRLYGTGQSGSCSHMHVINYPDEEKMKCQLVQHGIKLPTSCATGMPNFANYRLGPLDGSPSDTLGLDNHPIAKYRYEPDNIDIKRLRFTDLSYFRPETWSWDFGDGSPKISQRSPYHTYPSNGTYRVCLTVSNENSSNKSCRDISIGTSATYDEQTAHPADITLFPNPVQDILLVTIGEYIPERGYIELYNISGQQIHRQRAYYGHNNVDMSGLSAGTYVVRIVDGSYLIKEEKVVKI